MSRLVLGIEMELDYAGNDCRGHAFPSNFEWCMLFFHRSSSGETADGEKG